MRIFASECDILHKIGYPECDVLHKMLYLCSGVYLNKAYGTEKSDAGADNGAW